MGTVAQDNPHTQHAGDLPRPKMNFDMCFKSGGFLNITLQAFITLAMVAASSAAPQYAAAPVVHAVAAPDLAEPSPYTYTYAVADDYSKANFQQSESNDGTGAVTGSYSVNLPDGRIQTATYNANDLTGNVATVEYAGGAQYPPAPAGGYVAAAPVVAHAVHAAPVVAHAVHAPVVAHAVHTAPVVAHATHGIVAHG